MVLRPSSPLRALMLLSAALAYSVPVVLSASFTRDAVTLTQRAASSQEAAATADTVIGSSPLQQHPEARVSTEVATWPHNSCDKCPGTRFMRHTGYQAFAHWTNKPGAQNLLPQRFCPPKTQAALAEETILGLLAAGYTKVAEFLESSQVLMSLAEPATLLAPSDEAFEAGNIPVHLSVMLGDWRAEAGLTRNIMSYHLLKGMRPFSELVKSQGEEAKLETLLPDTEVQSLGFATAGLRFVKFRALPELNEGSLPTALLVKKDLLCNQLVLVHGINHMLVPPVSYLPAGTPAAPTFQGDPIVKPVPRTAQVMAA